MVARYGARLPLLVGPLIAAFGFVLFAVPAVGGSYWTTFFPAVIVLGLGMAVSVAPLTTVVMESIDQDRAGTASGINNAVARVAGLLAIAVLGVVMVTEFGAHLNRSLANVEMPDGVRSEIRSNEIRLAALQPPSGVDSGTAVAIKASIVSAFIFGFRAMMGICAVLAVASSLVAWRMIPDKTELRFAPSVSKA